MDNHELLKIVLEDIKNDICELRRDVKILLEFKWKIYGMALVCGVLGAAAFKLAIKVIA